ncbi:MFS transporter [Bacillus gobiensis]|uniref:MFS transporter n=1 Tax=Bacillus gobiensis TaxID=1441095 RepID=UPI003D1DE01E
MTKGEKGFVYSCLLFTLTSEMLLSPYYPQLFSEYFHMGTDGVQVTSVFIVCCRLIVIIMTPMWAVIAKRWSLGKLVTVTLVGMAGCKALLPMVHTFPQFLATSLVLLFFQSAIYLLYPAMVASSKNEGEKVKATTTYLFVLHGSVIVSGIAGSFVISEPLPLHSYYIFALIDIILVVLSCFISLNNKAITKERDVRNKERALKGTKWQWGFLVYLLIVFLFYIGHHAIRPYFTTFFDSSYTISQQEAGILYVMPSLVAIVMQFIFPKRYLQSHGKVILIGVTGVTGVLLFFQVLAGHIWLFVFIRVLYGMCFFVSFAAIDIIFFQFGIGKKSPFLYSLVASVQSTALLFAPMTAFISIQHNGMEGPFLLSGCLLIGAAVCMSLLFINGFKPLYVINKRSGRL